MEKLSEFVSLKELRERLPEYTEAVGRGRSFTVIRRSKPVFRITPVGEEEGMWETVVDFTQVKKGGVDIEEVLARIRVLKA